MTFKITTQSSGAFPIGAILLANGTSYLLLSDGKSRLLKAKAV